MDTYNLSAAPRDLSVPAKTLRVEGQIPAVIYGEGVENVNFQMDYQDFRRIYRKAGGSSIVDLEIDGKKFKSLVHRVDFDPVTDKITHVDFLNIRMDKEITAKIPLEFVGQAPAVANLGGILVHGKDEIEVKCLPDKLVHSIEVDLSSLEDFHINISVSDLNIPEGIEVLEDPENMIASVSAPREEEAEEAVTPVEGEGDKEEGKAEEGEEKKEEE